MVKNTFLAIQALLLCACASGPHPVDSPYSQIPVGSKLVLKRPLTVPADRVAVGLSSAGDPPAGVLPDQRDTSCELEMRRRAAAARTIGPDEFIVTKVRRDIEYVGLTPLQVAALGRLAYRQAGPGWEIHSVVLYLRSERQPDVYLVRCKYQDTIREGDPLGVTTVRWALGGDFDVELAQ